MVKYDGLPLVKNYFKLHNASSRSLCEPPVVSPQLGKNWLAAQLVRWLRTLVTGGDCFTTKKDHRDLQQLDTLQHAWDPKISDKEIIAPWHPTDHPQFPPNHQLTNDHPSRRTWGWFLHTKLVIKPTISCWCIPILPDISIVTREPLA